MAGFTDRVVLVTGAGSGIGAATSLRLRDEGARLVLVDRDEAGLAALDVGGAQALTVTADVADGSAVDRVVEAALDRFGRIDVLVANAGIWQERPFLELTQEDWDRVLGVNLRGTFLVCQAVAKVLVSQGHGGAIVLTASANSLVAEADTAHYNASKGGVLMLGKSMAVDLAPYGIRVNSIAPGTIETPLNRDALERMPESVVAASIPPLQRWGDPAECAAAIAFLASSDANYITGTTLVVDGGRLALSGPAK
ncbi:MAG: SDR family NAD(P)-dependent oxidoreductase [Nostocoides sp.]